jgi:hypothetical protein
MRPDLTRNAFSSDARATGGPRRVARLPMRYVAIAPLLALLIGFGAVRTNAFGAADRLDLLWMRVSVALHLTPDRPTLDTIVVTPRPTASPTPDPTPEPSRRASRQPTPTPEPTPVRRKVDFAVVEDHEAVFITQQTEKWCAVAGTQMVLVILGLAEPTPAFQQELAGRIGEWQSRRDSLNGGWGPGAVGKALEAYGAPGYELRAYETYTDALWDSAVAITETNQPVVMFPWWGAHTWVMTGYRADADPTVFDDARISGAYILDPWYNRDSSIWGPSDPPGTFENLAELERNWPAFQGPPGYESIGPGWTRPEGPYPDRDGKFVVLIPTTPR